METKLIRYILLTLLILWMGVIFAFSAQKGNESGDVSRDVAVKVAEIVYPGYEKLDEAQKSEVLNRLFIPVRKIAHFTEFFVLGELVFLFFTTYQKIPPFLKATLALIWGLVYAVSDELHQIFVDGRACSFFDVLIDCAGVLLAVLIGLIIVLKRRGERVG